MKKIRFYSFFCIFIFLFTNIVFAEQQNEEIPDYLYKEETEKGIYYLPNERKYEEYMDNYIASQITSTEIPYSTGNIIISTKGPFSVYDSACVHPPYIKIKESAPGILKQGTTIYLHIDDGTLLKEMNCDTTLGDVVAYASGNRNIIEINIEKQSTEPSEITITNIAILTNRAHDNKFTKRESILSISVLNTLPENMFSEYSENNIILNERFWMQDNRIGVYCYDYRFEGRLAFPANQNYYILNDTKFNMKGNSYIKNNILMVPLYSLVEALYMGSNYCFSYRYHYPYDISNCLKWNAENQYATVFYKRNAIFQNQSNIVQIFDEYNKDYSPKAITDTIQMPVNVEIKEGVLYVPVKYAIIAICYNNTAPYYWNEKTKTFYYHY